MSQNAIVKDIRSLPDVQSYSDGRNVAIQSVGVSSVEIPIRIKSKNSYQHVSAVLKVGVSLSAEEKGTHMSRFLVVISEWAKERVFDFNLAPLLKEVCLVLESESANISLEFNYFLNKVSPVTGFSAPMPVKCILSGTYAKENDDRDEAVSEKLEVSVPVATLCPCSKKISKYGAHNQRAIVDCEVEFKDNLETSPIWIDELSELIERCASCELYPILKREDEKFVTETQYENPRFAEDVLREAVIRLRALECLRSFAVKVVTLESIHAHNAYCFHRESLSDRD